MRVKPILKQGGLAALAALVTLTAACDGKHAPAANGVIQTKYPGQVSSGGETSGQIMARTARPETDATYAGGTPGIAGGSGGNTSGAEIGGATQESGQGPSSGTSQPSSAGRPGASLPAGVQGSQGGRAPAAAEAPAASNAAPQGAAAPSQMENKR